MRSVVVVLACLFFALTADARNTPQITAPPKGAQDRWPFYKTVKYLRIKEYNIHILGTASVSNQFMADSYHLIRNLVKAIKNPKHRKNFSGHRAYLITDRDPALPGGRGQRNTGGKGFSLFNQALVCKKAVDTMYPNARPQFRAWDTPVHEFGHAIEFTLKLQKKSDDVFSRLARNYNPKHAREYFPWAVQSWFASGGNGRKRSSMPRWELRYMAKVFSAKNKWVPKCH